MSLMSILDRHPRQLETLGDQRAGLEDMLKDMKRKDDILPKLMTSTGSYEDLFRKEIAKYNHICEEISQNLQAQGSFLEKSHNNRTYMISLLTGCIVSRLKMVNLLPPLTLRITEVIFSFASGLAHYTTTFTVICVIIYIRLKCHFRS
ncbi:putative protein-tyrosine-phosphatase [Helianthus anomalus]